MSDVTGELLIEQDAKDYGTVKFGTHKEFDDWLQAEHEYWSWCTKPSATELGIVNDARTPFWSSLEALRNTSRQSLDSEKEFKLVGKPVSWLKRYLSSGLISRTARAEFISSLRKGEHGDFIAAAALAQYLGSTLDPQSDRQPQGMRHPTFTGRVAIASFELGLGIQSTDAYATTAKAIASDFSSHLEKQTNVHREALEELRASHADIIEKHAAAEESHGAKVEATIYELTKSKIEALKAMDDKRKAFNEFMKLKAPVQYWTNKSEEHKKSAMKLQWGLISFASVGSIVIVAIFYWLFGRALELPNGPQSNTHYASILLTAGAAIAVTILFWVARFLSRLFLSERHMAIDAKLRATLAETYLAMTEDGKVSETDRALVLPALFRSSSDGIIHDDSGLDGLLALIARHLEKPAKA